MKTARRSHPGMDLNSILSPRTWSRIFFLLGSLAIWPLNPTIPVLGQTHRIDVLSDEHYPQLRGSDMFHINDQGVAAGCIATQNIDGPFLPTTYHGDGQFRNYGLQSQEPYWAVRGIDQDGNIAGNTSFPDNSYRPYVTRNGVVEYLPFDDSVVLLANAVGMTTGGTVFGQYVTMSDQNNFYTYRDSSLQSYVQPYQSVILVAGNDRGLFAGQYFDSDTQKFHPYLFDTETGSMTSLQTPTGFNEIELWTGQITNADLVYGLAWTADYSDFRYGIWNSDGSFSRFFGVDEGSYQTWARFNDLGQAISVYDGGVWQFDGTQWLELQIDGLADFEIRYLNDFNNRGDFVGFGAHSGTQLWGFVANAVPEPSSGSLLGLMLLGGIGLRRRRKASN